MPHLFDRIRRWPIALAILAASACEPSGHLEWGDGTDTLRTALVKFTSDGTFHHASLLLSNGQLECGLPSNTHPSAQTQAYQALGAALCREGARHVTVDLYRRGGADWEGTFLGVPDLAVADIAAGDRLATATYYGVERSFLVDLPYLPRGYAVAEDDLRLDMAGGGEVRIHAHHSRLIGEFIFPDGEVKGHFRATICEEDTSTIDWLHPTPAHTCP